MASHTESDDRERYGAITVPMAKRGVGFQCVPRPRRLPPTEWPLRPLCPACGAERVSLDARIRVTFDVVAVGLSNDLQVLDHQVDGAGWDDDDVAHCDRCGWRGLATDLRSAAPRGDA